MAIPPTSFAVCGNLMYDGVTVTRITKRLNELLLCRNGGVDIPYFAGVLFLFKRRGLPFDTMGSSTVSLKTPGKGSLFLTTPKWCYRGGTHQKKKKRENICCCGICKG